MADKTIPALKILRGNVGVNTATPTEKLYVDGAGYFEGGGVRDGSWHRGIEITTENANFSSLYFGGQSTTKYSGIIWTSSTSGNSGNSRGAQIYAQPTSATNTDIRFDTNNAVGSSGPTTKMVVRGDGKVGIGTDGPGHQLHLYGADAEFEIQRTGSYADTINFGMPGGVPTIVGGTDLALGGTGTWTEHVRIKANGSVGIGTASPGSLLTIGGNSDDGDNACALRIIDEDTTGGSKLPAIMFYGGSTIQGRIRGGDGTFTIAVGSAPSTALTIDATSRKFTLGSYGSGTHTGTAAYKLAVDSSGNIIETAVGAGQVDGSGTANKLALWTDTDTIGNSIISQGVSGSTYAQIGGGVRITGNHTDTGSQLNIWCDSSGHGRAAVYDWFFYTGGNNSRSNVALFLKADGNVGIGETNPDKPLHIKGTNTAGIVIENTTNATNMDIDWYNNVGSVAGRIRYSEGTGDFSFMPNQSTNAVVFRYDGNVGISTTSPAYKFEVKTSVTGNWLSRIYNTATSGNSGGLLVRMDEPGSTGSALGVYANGGYKFKVEPDGEVQILSGAAYTTHLNYQNSGTHYITMANGGYTYFRGSSNSITTMTVTGAGKVGILDSSPQTTLAVNGEASFGDGARLSLIGLSIASSAASPNIKIRTKIPFALGGADFTVNIKGFIYGNQETANLTVCWHYYNSTFYNATCSSAGSWAPTIQLSAEDWDSSGTKKVCICLSTPGYWVKAYVESMFSHSYNDQYTDGWTWVDGTASGTGNDLASLSYRSDFGNNFRMLSNGCIGMGADPLTNAHLTVNGGLAVGDATYQSNMNNGAADFSVDCNGTSMISWVSNYLQVGGTGQNWSMKMYNGLLQTYSNDLTIIGGGTGTSHKLHLGTNGQTQTITCNNGSVGINTTSPAQKLHVAGSTLITNNNYHYGYTSGGALATLIGITSSNNCIVGQNNANIANTYIYGGTGDINLNPVGDVKVNNANLFVDGSVGVGSASPAATLDVKQGTATNNNQLMKVADDVLSVYKVTGLSNHTVTLTCGSYFQAEVVITANQTNGGTYNNLYIRGIWSNNHTSHHWDEIENIGSLTGSSFSITVGQNDVTNSGKLTITHTYSSGSFSQMVVRVTDLYGSAHSYSIT